MKRPVGDFGVASLWGRAFYAHRHAEAIRIRLEREPWTSRNRVDASASLPAWSAEADRLTLVAALQLPWGGAVAPMHAAFAAEGQRR